MRSVTAQPHARVRFQRAIERRGLVRYLSEGTPRLRDVAKVTASLALKRDALDV